MNGKIDSKTRILISLFNKYSKPYKRRGILLVEDDHIFVREVASLFSLYGYNEGWRKRGILKNMKKPHEQVKKTFYSKSFPSRFVYEIKEGYELSIH